MKICPLDPRLEAERPTARFDVGDICEVIGAAQVRSGEELSSGKVAQLTDGPGAESTRDLLKSRLKSPEI